MGWTFVIYGGAPLLLGFGLFGFVVWLMLDKGSDDVEESGGDGGGGSKVDPRPRRPGPTHARGLHEPVRIVKADDDSRSVSRPVRQLR